MVSPGAGVTFHVDRYLAGQDDHTEEGVSQEAARKSPWGNDIRPGEFLEPWSEQFSFGPAPEPFSYAPGEHGYQPLNEQFDWDPKGDMPRPDPGFIPELNSWGWHEQPDGTWRAQRWRHSLFCQRDHDGQYHWGQDVSCGQIFGWSG